MYTVKNVFSTPPQRAILRRGKTFRKTFELIYELPFKIKNDIKIMFQYKILTTFLYSN